MSKFLELGFMRVSHIALYHILPERNKDREADYENCVGSVFIGKKD